MDYQAILEGIKLILFCQMCSLIFITLNALCLIKIIFDKEVKK